MGEANIADEFGRGSGPSLVEEALQWATSSKRIGFLSWKQ